MFTTLNEFEGVFKTETAATMKVMEALTDESLNQAVTDDHRTLGRIAWHVCTTIPEMMGHTGLKVDVLSENSPMPKTAREFVHAYGAVTNILLEQINRNWEDEDLEAEDEMYGETWKRKFTLQAMITHEVHHRGQMTVLMRQAGIKVPSIYGPAKEDWAQYGMEEPEI